MCKGNFNNNLKSVEKMNLGKIARDLEKGYRIIRQLNEELAAAGYMTVQAKVPRTYWSERFYFGKRNIV